MVRISISKILNCFFVGLYSFFHLFQNFTCAYFNMSLCLLYCLCCPKHTWFKVGVTLSYAVVCVSWTHPQVDVSNYRGLPPEIDT